MRASKAYFRTGNLMGKGAALALLATTPALAAPTPDSASADGTIVAVATEAAEGHLSDTIGSAAPVPAALPRSAVAMKASLGGRDPAVFERFNALREPMITTQFPPLIDTLLGDTGGWRSWLADHDIGFEVQIATNTIAALTDTGAPRDPQVYNGQRPTLQTHALNATASIGLHHEGNDQTRLIVTGGYLITSFDPNGPNTGSFKELALYQTFLGKTVEIKAGFMENYVEYAGLFSGGNITLTSGLASLVPIEVGLSAEPGPTQAINIRINGGHGLYTKFGVQRSTNPLGNAEEVRNHGIGLDWSQPGAKALYIGEVGIRQVASPTQRQFWLRAGYIYNTSDYKRFTGGTDHNQSAYVLVDYQLTRPDKALFFRGLYVGASAETAPQSVNVFARSAELRAYYVGPFDARPTDAISASITYNHFSDDLHAAYRGLNLRTERDQFGMSIAYVYHATLGINVTPAVQYLVHPTFLPGYRNALLGALSVYIAL